VYPIIKHIHLLTISISLAGFILRMIWIFMASPLARHRLTRILPHINDTLLLVSGIGLAWVTHQYPWEHGWLAAKVIALLVYIYLGARAIKSSGGLRGLIFTVAALLTFGYMVMVALSKSPWPFS
jgi:uncharacterized membrane protein SirB2